MRKRTGIAALIICIAIACKQAPDIIPLPEMKFVMWDIMSADALYTQQALKDTLARTEKLNVQLYQKVFDIHHISRKQFFASYKYYEANPDKMKVLIDSVNAYGGREKSKADSLQQKALQKKAAAAIKPVADSIKKPSIDSLRKQHIITPVPPVKRTITPLLPIKRFTLDSSHKVKLGPQIKVMPGLNH